MLPVPSLASVFRDPPWFWSQGTPGTAANKGGETATAGTVCGADRSQVQDPGPTKESGRRPTVDQPRNVRFSEREVQVS